MINVLIWLISYRMKSKVGLMISLNQKILFDLIYGEH